MGAGARDGDGAERNDAYRPARGLVRAGRALSNRTQVAPARSRTLATLPAGQPSAHAPRPEPEWITAPVPPILWEETLAQVQAKLDAN